MHTNLPPGIFRNAFSVDKRKRRRQHRKAATYLFSQGGETFADVARWHLQQARWL